MTRKCHDRFNDLQATLTLMSAQSYELFADAFSALRNLDAQLAEAVVDRDRNIDRLEIEIQHKCHDLLTLEQPVAGDGRLIIAAIRINTDLERISDQSVNIAKQVVMLGNRSRQVDIPPKLLQQGMCARDMLVEMCVALQKHDPQSAAHIMKADQCVDALHNEMYSDLAHLISRGTDSLDEMIAFLRITRELERIADHVVNICQEIVFIATGETVRHRSTS